MQVVDLQTKKPTFSGWLFYCLVDFWSEVGETSSIYIQQSLSDSSIGQSGP
jgi:hypothetical protein